MGFDPKSKGQKQFADYFNNVIRLLQHSKSVGDVPWRNSAKLLKLDELPELCLGFGGKSTRGRDLAGKIKNRVLATAREIIDLGIRDPELFSLVGLLEEGVGPDTIGDMTANALLPTLIEITEGAATALNIKVKDAIIGSHECRLPFNAFSGKSILLTPLDVLRDLPVAADWSDVSTAAFENQAIRNRVNKLIGEIWKLRGKKQKAELRASVLASREAFQALLDSVNLLKDDSYDFEGDPEGHRIFREALVEFAARYPLKITNPQQKNHAELKHVVGQIIDQFRQLIENNGVNYLLWSRRGVGRN